MPSLTARRPSGATTRQLPYIYHSSFDDPDAVERYGGKPDCADFNECHLGDDETRDCSRRMHYAAYRAEQATDDDESAYWRERYHVWRNRIVLGNIKLVYKAVRRWRPEQRLHEDFVAECQVVFIQAVAGFDPWVGMRFSTYTYICVRRALSRQSTRRAADRLAQAIPLEELIDGEPRELADWRERAPMPHRLDEYFHDTHPLLSRREKLVLARRFLPVGGDGEKTLQEVGNELGLSKERVRQLETSGLDKLRKALYEHAFAG